MTGIRVTAGLALLAALAACGSSGPAQVKVHGSFDIDFASSGQCVSGGEQVRITDTAGKLLATASLPAAPVTRTITVQGQPVQVQEYRYSISVPDEPKYGITAGSLPVYYATRGQLTGGLDLSC